MPIGTSDLAWLNFLLSQRWIVQSTRRVLRRSDIRILPEYRLQIGTETVPIAGILPWTAKPHAATIDIPTAGGAIRLVQAQPSGSPLLRTTEWAVRARRTAEMLALAVTRQLTGREPEQALFEEDVAFLLQRGGPAGLEDLIERSNPRPCRLRRRHRPRRHQKPGPLSPSR